MTERKRAKGSHHKKLLPGTQVLTAQRAKRHYELFKDATMPNPFEGIRAAPNGTYRGKKIA